MDGFFDMDGHPITVEQWGALFEDMAGRTIAKDHLDGDRLLITVWLGYVDPDIESARLFGTALLHGPNGITELQTYDAKAAALAGHARHLTELKR